MGKKAIVILVLAGMVLCLLWLISKNRGINIHPGEDQKIMSEAGRRLFFDTRLSFNNTRSCGSCHDPKFAFTDGYRRSITASGENVKHNAPSLVNITFQNYFDWANPAVTALEKQQERPLFSEHPAELGAKGNELLILNRLKKDSLYQQYFAVAFPCEKDPFSFTNIIHCIASFVRTLRSSNAPYDQFMNGDTAALSQSAKAGMELFFSDRLACGSCHIAPMFTRATMTKNTDSIYFNTGLYNVAGSDQYPAEDKGLETITGRSGDNGKFKTPSLRNVAITAPYMHDGSINTLEEVLDMYARGGRNTIAGPFAGDGKNNKLKDGHINGFALSAIEKKQLIDFLFSLTDSSVLTNPAFQNPFTISNK
jgi:cytochrome c peroxidase